MAAVVIQKKQKGKYIVRHAEPAEVKKVDEFDMSQVETYLYTMDAFDKLHELWYNGDVAEEREMDFIFQLLDERVPKEFERQYKKWGHQDPTPVEWHSYTAEEVGEVVKDMNNRDYEHAITECVEAIACACRWAYALERARKEAERERGEDAS